MAAIVAVEAYCGGMDCWGIDIRHGHQSTNVAFGLAPNPTQQLSCTQDLEQQSLVSEVLDSQPLHLIPCHWENTNTRNTSTPTCQFGYTPRVI